VVLNYIKAVFRLKPFRDLVEKELASELRLRNGITIEVRTASFRSVRGYTVLAAILDEVAFLRSEESASPDTELLTALLPALATCPGSLLMAISTPYAKSGVLWQALKEFFGKDDQDVPLVWRAPTTVMNPTFHQSAVRAFFEWDKVAARAEYEAEFREDLESYMSPELIASLTVKERSLLPPEEGKRYQAFVDVSGGRQDSFTLGVAHREVGGRVIIDRLEEVKAPVPEPADTIKLFCEILRGYRVTEVRTGTEELVSSDQKMGQYIDHMGQNEIYLHLGLYAMHLRIA
jgi:hypothetical protein